MSLLPVFFSTIISVVLLHAYTEWVLVLIIPVLAATLLVFRFCEFCVRKKSRRNYVAVMLAVLIPVIFLIMYRQAGVSFLTWMLMPTTGAEYSTYFVAVFFFACFFIPSAVYYFSCVIYRAQMLMLIIAIPYIMNYRRSVEVSFLIEALTAGLFFAVMAYYGKSDLTVYIRNVKSKSVYAFTAVVIGLALGASLLVMKILPKTEFEDNGKVNSGINLSGNSQYSSRADASGVLSDRILFLVEADEPLYFIREVFADFNGERWEFPNDNDLNTGFLSWKEEAYMQNFDSLFEALCSLGASVTEEFGGIKKLNNIERIKTARIIPQDYTAKYILAPVRTFDVSGLPYGVREVRNKMDKIFIADGNAVSEEYHIKYFSEVFRQNNNFQDFSQQVDEHDWNLLLFDLWDTADEAASDMFKAFLTQQINAEKYKQYGNDYKSWKLQELALNITQDYDSDYEKAKALETYFRQNGYKYDLKASPKNKDMEHFVFESKKGWCVHYATAMTLMARMAGLNARYVEGFTSTEQNEQGQYVIRKKNSHAFVQVYMPVYGWVTFDPTVADESQSNMNLFNFIKEAMESHVFIVFAIISGLMICLFMGYLLYTLFIEEMIFRYKLKKSGVDFMVKLYQRVLQLVWRKLNVENITTAALARLIFDTYGLNIQNITNNFERAVYGKEKISAEEMNEALYSYILLRRRLNKLRIATAGLLRQPFSLLAHG